MTLKRMDNVLIVVDDLEAVKAFFIELGLKLEGETTVEGPLVAGLIGLKDVRATLAMMRTPDGQGIELDKFHTPDATRFGPVDAPVNTLGIRRIMFTVDGIDAVVARMRAHGAELIGEMRYGDTYRLAYIRGPEGIIVALAEQLGDPPDASMQNRSMPSGDVIPELAYPDIAQAVAWLCSAFGFRERLRIADHRSQISVGSGSVVAVQGNPSGPGSVMVRVPDVDAHYEAARVHGARVSGPPTTYPYGERQYSAVDPAGHRWIFTQSVADVDPADWGGRLVRER